MRRMGRRNEDRPRVVTFTGGMGAQIISAGIYFDLKSRGLPVFADLSYFDKPEAVAEAGKKGECSHWSWQLDGFGLQPEMFDVDAHLNRKKVDLIKDGPEKLSMALQALYRPEIRDHFQITGGVETLLPPGFEGGYLCVHIRRGDYVNVASHLVPDETFVKAAGKFSRLLGNIVVVSDSPLDESLRRSISDGYDQAVFLDDVSAYQAHCIMRSCAVLICSNSQFSLIAAILNPSALVLLPQQWFAGKHRMLEEPIHRLCGFQLMD